MHTAQKAKDADFILFLFSRISQCSSRPLILAEGVKSVYSNYVVNGRANRIKVDQENYIISEVIQCFHGKLPDSLGLHR